MPETTSKTPGTPVEGEMEGSGGNRFQVLCYEQVDRLHRVMEASIPVHGRGNFPTLEVRLKDLVRVVRRSLLRNGIHLRDVRLNGGAASYVLSSVDDDQTYNDLDLIFGLTLTSEHDLRKVKDSVLNSLLDFLPHGVNKDRMSAASLNEAYVHKMVKICTDKDRWSLISLANIGGRNVELKFADTIRRQFEFSVDSFQIVLDSLMTFYDVSSSPITEHFYPTVVAESVYGDFDVALFHLNHKLIATRNPEEIRGGGLLKYCNLLVRGYAATDDSDILLLEKYMCSRFFIDFSDVAEQKVKLENYLSDHFVDDEAYLKYQYLMILWSVVNESTICLMGHERRQTLDLIHQLGQRVLMVRDQRAAASQHGQATYQNQPFLTFDQDKSNLIIDQVYYGPFSYSYPGMDQPHHYYTVYSYDYTNPSSSSSPSSCSSSSPSLSSSSPSPSSSCPYCEVCTQCVV